MNTSLQKIRTALLSVSNKDHLITMASCLQRHRIKILSTGGTGELLKKYNIAFTEVSEYTNYPEMMGGRIKTLHPRIYGGILGRRGTDDKLMEEHGMLPIDLVITNLYPFEETIKNNQSTLEHAIENIDIGGPCMLRAAAKNYAYVAVVIKPEDYKTIQQELDANDGSLTLETRFTLAIKAFSHTTEYDQTIANFLNTQQYTNNPNKPESPNSQQAPLPNSLHYEFHKLKTLRYGENPHQRAALYSYGKSTSTGNVINAKQIHGKELSYNNLVDAETALECVKLFEQPTCVIVKHANPCGVAESDNLFDAYTKAYNTDPTSAFGGIIAFNKKLDAKTLICILDRQFVEVIIAPDIAPEAHTALKKMNKPNIRVLNCGLFQPPKRSELFISTLAEGVLIQERDTLLTTQQNTSIVTKVQPSPSTIEDLYFAWKVCKFVKSNAIVLAKNLKTIGIGPGQTSRIHSTKIAALKAKEAQYSVAEAVMASDAFFPFTDNVEMAKELGICGIIQPGGSINDQEVIDCADQHGITMLFTHTRHFRH